MRFVVESINIADTKGVSKNPVSLIECIADYGLEGDAHAGSWHRQVSFLAVESVEQMTAKITDEKEKGVIKPGAFAENILTRGVDWSQVKIGGKIFINDKIEMEVTQIGKECHAGCQISRIVGSCIMPRVGIFARVIKGGTIHVGDSGYYGF